MLQIEYQNEWGSLSLHRKPCRVLSVTGLGLPEREFETVRYADSHGQQTMSVTDCPRVITMSVDLLMNCGLGRELARMARILYRPGRLLIRSAGKTRVIPCRCTAWEEDGRTPILAKLILQFTCDDPAFLEEKERSEGVYQRTNLIYGSFTLPTVFSSKITEKDVINTGDLPVQPILILRNTGKDTASAGVTIVNTPPSGVNQTFQLTRPLLAGEQVRVDFPGRRVDSDQRGSLLHSISDDTYLNAFTLEQGKNHIEVTAGIGDKMAVSCIFIPKYLEGMY